MVRRSLTGLFNPVLSDPNFREIELSRQSFLASRPDFAFRITNFEFQVREIPDPNKLLGTTDKAHQKYKTFIPGKLPYERGGDARRKFWMKPLKGTSLGVAQPFLHH